MNVIKILPISDIATEMHNPMINKYRNIKLGDTELTISIPCNINVFVTNECPNKCEWCINKEYSGGKCSISSLKMLLTELKRINTKTNCQNFEITITGGEPLLYPGLFTEIINLCYMYKIPIRTISTTGINILNRAPVTDLFGNKLDKPVYKHMLDNNAKYNINISRHAISPKENAMIFGVDKEPLSIEDLGKISEVFRLYGGEVRASCNIAPHEKFGIHDNFMDIIEYIHYLYKEGVKSFIFREIIGSDRSKECMIKLTKHIEENCKNIETLYIGNGKIVSMYKITDLIIGEEFLVKVYNNIKDIDLSTWHKSAKDYYKDILGYAIPVCLNKKSIEGSIVHSGLAFRNGKLYKDFNNKDLIFDCNKE